jgi:hypothetical protein
MSLLNTTFKVCPQCGGGGPFSKDSSRKDGLSRLCKSCAKAATKAWRIANPERSRAGCAAWKAANPEVARALSRQWYANNTTHARVYARQYAQDHQEDRRLRACLTKALNRSAVKALKEGVPCMDCGGIYPAHCMDFDHVYGAKKGKQLSFLYGCAQTSVLLEVAKCDLVCACCHRVRTDNRRPPPTSRNNRKRQMFRDAILALKSQPCIDCGKLVDPRAMEFDHVRGVKTANISGMSAFPWDRVLDELAKCDLVCANCHRDRTERRRCPSR